MNKPEQLAIETLQTPISSEGSVEVKTYGSKFQVKLGDRVWDFHEPKGRDLAKMRETLPEGADQTVSGAHILAALCDTLETTADYWLDHVPLKVFIAAGEQVNRFF